MRFPGWLPAILAAPADAPMPPGKGLGDAVQQLQSAPAPLLQLLSPDMRDAIAGIGQTAEE